MLAHSSNIIERRWCNITISTSLLGFHSWNFCPVKYHGDACWFASTKFTSSWENSYIIHKDVGNGCYDLTTVEGDDNLQLMSSSSNYDVIQLKEAKPQVNRFFVHFKRKAFSNTLKHFLTHFARIAETLKSPITFCIWHVKNRWGDWDLKIRTL